jgi:hypothetical protein
MLFSLYGLRTDHAQKIQFCCCIRKTTQRTSHVIPSQRLYWCAVALCVFGRGVFTSPLPSNAQAIPSVHTRSIRRHIPEDGILHSHRRETHKSYIVFFYGEPTHRHIRRLETPGGDTFLRNGGSHNIYTTPHPKRRNSSGIFQLKYEVHVFFSIAFFFRVPIEFQLRIVKKKLHQYFSNLKNFVPASAITKKKLLTVSATVCIKFR